MAMSQCRSRSNMVSGYFRIYQRGLIGKGLNAALAAIWFLAVSNHSANSWNNDSLNAALAAIWFLASSKTDYD